MPFEWNDILRLIHPPPALSLLEQFERQIGAPLPAEYRSFLLKYNGGEVIEEMDHDLPLGDTPDTVSLSSLNPLSAGAPFVGLVQSRDIQERNFLDLRETIRIGDDGGTGFFLLGVYPPFLGRIFFIWKDDMCIYDDQEWARWHDDLPEVIHPVCDSFEMLPDLIEAGRL